MNMKQLLGREIIKQLNKAKKLYSPEYENYYTNNITPLIKNKMEEIDNRIEALEEARYRLYYHFSRPASEINLRDLLDEMGYTER